MTATIQTMCYEFADAFELLVFADFLEEKGCDDKRCQEYRVLAQLVQEHAWLGSQLEEVKKLGQLLTKSRHYEKCLCSLLQDEQGRFTDGRIITGTTRQERATLLRRKFDRERRPWPLDTVYPMLGKVARLKGAEARENRNFWLSQSTTLYEVILDDGENEYAIQAKYYGLLCRRHPQATWHAAEYNPTTSPLALVEDDKIVALCMPTTRTT